MTLGSFAVVVGAPTKWVANALQVLGRRRDYTFDSARTLKLVRVLNERFGVGLKRGWDMASRVLAEPSDRSAWSVTDPGTGVTLGVDRERFLSSLACAVGASRVWYRPGRRGRPGPRAPLEQRLRDSATDLAAMVRTLDMTAAERLERIDAAYDLVAAERSADPSLGALVERLSRARVAFVVHGAVAAALHGALCIPTVVDVWASPDPRNLDRLARALRELSASVRGVGPGLPLLLDSTTFETEPVVPLETVHGSLTVVREIPNLRGLTDGRTVAMRVSDISLDVLEIGALHESLVGFRSVEMDEVATQLEAIMELGLER